MSAKRADVSLTRRAPEPAARLPWVVLPARGESAGKTRLKAVLDDDARMRLNRRLLRRTLDVLVRWQGSAAHCIVVSSCRRTLRAAARRGALALREPAPRQGLNAAIAAAARLAWQRGARSVLVIPADLPMLSSSSLNRLLAAAEPNARAVLAPDRARRGTNALLVLRRTRLSWAFGEDSLRKHGERLSALGWAWVLCSIPELAFDLDTAEDLACLRALARFSRAARMV